MLRGAKTRSEFADVLGLKSPQALENYEKGRVPSALVLAAIAGRLGQTMEQLLFGEQRDVVETGMALRESPGPPDPLDRDEARKRDLAVRQYRTALAVVLERCTDEQIDDLYEWLRPRPNKPRDRRLLEDGQFMLVKALLREMDRRTSSSDEGAETEEALDAGLAEDALAPPERPPKPVAGGPSAASGPQSGGASRGSKGRPAPPAPARGEPERER